jgi:hypothetical protein
MYGQKLVYDLAFRSRERNGVQTPQLVFRVTRGYLAELIAALEQKHSRVDLAASAYLEGDKKFYPLTMDSDPLFGFGKCGVCEHSGDFVDLAIWLVDGIVPESVCTISMIVIALFGLCKEEIEAAPEALQQVCLWSTGWSRSTHGHSIGGMVHLEMLTWLRTYGAQAEGASSRRPFPDPVVQAMRQTWASVSPRSAGLATECRGLISREGTFFLTCLGNACSVGVAPHGTTDTDESAWLSSHNLDSAWQQLTLLAGLAMLCEWVRNERGV